MSDHTGNHRFDIPPPRDGYTKIAIPPRLNVPDMPESQAQETIKNIMEIAYTRAAEKVNGVIETVDLKQNRKFQEHLNEINMGSFDYLRQQLDTISHCYIGCRTGLVNIIEEGTKRNVTSGYISDSLTELADLIGPKLTEQIYRTLTTEIDNVLAEHYEQGRKK